MKDFARTVLENGIKAIDSARGLRATLLDKEDRAANVRQKVAAERAGIYAEVCAAQSGGKPLYTNDGQRKAEAADREQDNEELQKLLTELKEAEKEVAVMRTDIESLNSKASIYKAYLHGGNLAAGLLENEAREEALAMRRFVQTLDEHEDEPSELNDDKATRIA